MPMNVPSLANVGWRYFVLSRLLARKQAKWKMSSDQLDYCLFRRDRKRRKERHKIEESKQSENGCEDA